MNAPASKNIRYFRARRAGPESLLEDIIAQRADEVFGSGQEFHWAAGSLAIGAGMPDLIFVACRPEVFALAATKFRNDEILAYLKTVGRARLETISCRTGEKMPRIVRCLDALIEAEAVQRESDTFSLCGVWREILPDIVTIEAKVDNWQKAISQAARNRIFAHRSFVALPFDTAMRVREEELFGTLGIGLLSVSTDGEVNIVRRPVRRSPKVWTYYYRLARIVAETGGSQCHSPSQSAKLKQSSLTITS